MRTLLLHLSDIHIKLANDPVLRRGKEIVRSIQDLDYSLDACVLVISGDVAWSGNSEQYGLGFDFLSELIADLERDLPGAAPIIPVVIPGNHDCDFTGDLQVREMLLSQVFTTRTEEVATPVVDALTSLQNAFFEFRNIFAPTGLQRDSRLYYEYHIPVGTRTLLFRCLNTAWCSQLREDPGKLHFPIRSLPDDPTDADLSVAIFHHPYQWFHPNNARRLRTWVEGTADLVLTGHEHVASSAVHINDSGAEIEHVEGGVLQETGDPARGAFNAIVLDFEAGQRRHYRLSWTGKGFAREEANPAWRALRCNRIRQTNEFRVGSDWRRYLDDPGAELTHGKVGSVHLSDIYLYPDVEEIRTRRSGLPPRIRGDQVLSRFIECQHLLVTADEQAGKTALCKRLFADFHSNGQVPLFLDGHSLQVRNEDQFLDDVWSAFRRQYDGDVERYRQLERHRRVLIVDNFHQVRYKGGMTRSQFVQLLTRIADKVALVSADYVEQMDDVSGTHITEENGFHRFEIQPFGHLQRDLLTERWLRLDPDLTHDDDEVSRQLTFLKRQMDTVIGKNFIPPYPIFLLAMLQAREAGSAVNLSGSTYGYFYEIFIRTSLASGSTKEALDVRLGYLTFLAYRMFEVGATELTTADFEAFHREYEGRYDIKVSADQLRRELISRQILDGTEHETWFRHQYAYFYFAALYMAQRIAMPAVRAQIQELADNLHKEEKANILLFLVHLSRDPFIIEAMLGTARKIFSGIAPATLERGTLTFLDEEDTDRLKFVYSNKTSTQARRNALAAMDANERQAYVADTSRELPTIEGDPEFWKFMDEVGAGFKTIQILGQILKNFPGSMEGEEKKQIAEECYRLGLRIINAHVDLLHAARFGLIDHLLNEMQADGSTEVNISGLEVIRIAQQKWYGTLHFISYAIIKRLSYAVGVPELQPTYDRVLQAMRNPATELIHTSVRLDQATTIPRAELIRLSDRLEPNRPAMNLLRHLVVHRFHMFPAETAEKQALCARLDIDFQSVQVTNPRAKLIGAGKATPQSRD